VWAGHDACFALSLTKSHRKMLSACKGVVALKIPVPPTKSFAAEIFLMKGDPVTMIHGRYQTTVYTFFISSGQFSSPVLRLSARVQSTAVPRWNFDLVAEHGSHSLSCKDQRMLERGCLSSFAKVASVVLALS
jgi:hypothetical protein